MREIGLPCSVITSHGEPPNCTFPKNTVLEDAVCVSVFSATNTTNSSVQFAQPTVNETTPLTSLAVLDGEGVKVWSEEAVHKDNSQLVDVNHISPRIRKQKRPYSPVLSEKRSATRKSSSLKSRNSAEDTQDACQKPFSCEKCKAPYVVNPARSRSSGKTYGPRRVFDPAAKKALLVCNACRLSLSRNRQEKPSKKQPVPSDEAKSEFVKECTVFSASLVERLKDPDASRLYCPAFKLRPCKCLQNYLTEPDEEERSRRALNLLHILKRAKELSAQKNSVIHGEEPRPPGLLNRKSRMFEAFVQEMRGQLRSELKLCERACQRVLVYSNNFLHKQLKTAPDQSARIQQLGGGSRPQLRPIAELPQEHCCQERCVMMALTHSRLLEDWRAAARRSQREARRVLAEMLTPSGGSKANCYKFIKMVTGCSHTTICLVNEQMWRTQGDREPPEHGLKRRWRKQAEQNTEVTGDTLPTGSLPDCDDADFREGEQVEREEGEQAGDKGTIPESETTSEGPCLTDIHILTARELRELPPVEASRQLQQQRRKLASIQRQMARQMRQLDAQRQQRPPIILGCCSGTDAALAQSPGPVQPPTPVVQQSVTHQPQVLHILEIPATTSVIPSIPDTGPQPTSLSMLSASGEFEPIANISVNVAPGQPLGTVFFVPDYEGNNAIFNTNQLESETVHLQHSQTQQPHGQCPSHPLPLSQTQGQIQPHNSNNATQPSAQLCTQPVQFSSVQLHLPVDIPLQLAVQPAEQPLSSLPQPQQLVLPAPQPLTYSVTQPVPSALSASQTIMQSSAATATVNAVSKENQYVQTTEPPRLYYLENVSSHPD